MMRRRHRCSGGVVVLVTLALALCALVQSVGVAEHRRGRQLPDPSDVIAGSMGPLPPSPMAGMKVVDRWGSSPGFGNAEIWPKRTTEGDGIAEGPVINGLDNPDSQDGAKPIKSMALRSFNGGKQVYKPPPRMSNEQIIIDTQRAAAQGRRLPRNSVIPPDERMHWFTYPSHRPTIAWLGPNPPPPTPEPTPMPTPHPTPHPTPAPVPTMPPTIRRDNLLRALGQLAIDAINPCGPTCRTPAPTPCDCECEDEVIVVQQPACACCAGR